MARRLLQDMYLTQIKEIDKLLKQRKTMDS